MARGRSRADIESEKERTPGGYGGRGREVTMQMQEYIYLGTTPMYFLGASGRIVGGESNPHTPGGNPRPPPSLSFTFLALYSPSTLSPFHPWLSRSPLLLPPNVHACARGCTPPPTPILRRFTGKLAPSPGLIDRQVMGQFNLISKINNRQRPRWSIYSEIPRAESRYTPRRERRRSRSSRSITARKAGKSFFDPRAP